MEVFDQAYQNPQDFRELLPNGVELEMIAVPPGTFLMGSPANESGQNPSESPQHEVAIPPFFIGKYPITQIQWLAITSLPDASQVLDPFPSNFKGANRPVEQISWHQAEQFCELLAQFTSKPYRLPTEAEWEYACRAETVTAFHSGEALTTDLANFNGTNNVGERACRLQTTDVGLFPPNAFGLYDMHGNIWEWCLDSWHDSYKGAPTDGSAWVTNESFTLRVQRGGSWDLTVEHCRSANRRRTYPNKSSFNQGLRVVCPAFS